MVYLNVLMYLRRKALHADWMLPMMMNLFPEGKYVLPSSWWLEDYTTV